MSLNIQKNELHHYLDLLRKPVNSTDSNNNDIYYNPLHNVIRTMNLSRHGEICSENFSNLDFRSIDLRNIHFSKFGSYPCDFRGSKLYIENLLPGGRSVFNTSSFSALCNETVSKSSDKIVLVDRGIFHHNVYVFDGECCRQHYAFQIPSYVNDCLESLDSIQLFKHNTNEYLGFFYSEVDSEKAYENLQYSTLIYNIDTKKEEFSAELENQAISSLIESNVKKRIKEYIKGVNKLEYESLDIDISAGIAIDSNGILYKFDVKDLKLREYTSIIDDSHVIQQAWLFNNSKMCLVTTVDGKHMIYQIGENGAFFIGQLETTTKTICDICFTNDSKYIDVWLVDELTRIDINKKKFIKTSSSKLLFKIDRKGMVHYLSDTVNNDNNYMRRRNRSIIHLIHQLEKNRVIVTNDLIEALESDTLRCAAVNKECTHLLIYDYKDETSELKFIKLKENAYDIIIASQISKLQVVSLSFSPDGLYCAIACTNGTIKICDSRLQDILYTYYCVPGVYMGGCDFDEAIVPDIIRDIINQYDLNVISPDQRSLGALAELKDDAWSGAGRIGNGVFYDGERTFEMIPLDYFYSNKLKCLYIVCAPMEEYDDNYSNECSVSFFKEIKNGMISKLLPVTETEWKIISMEYSNSNGSYPICFKVGDERYIVLHGMHLQETGDDYVVVCDFLEINAAVKHIDICKCLYIEDGLQIVPCESDYERDLVINRLNEEKMFL